MHVNEWIFVQYINNYHALINDNNKTVNFLSYSFLIQYYQWFKYNDFVFLLLATVILHSSLFCQGANFAINRKLPNISG